MKLGFFWITILLSVFLKVSVAANWSPQDYEIFSLNDKIKQDIGQDVTFYSWLGLLQGPKSTLQEITKAYRKKSRQLHPDKFAGNKKLKKTVEERFQRLSLVGNILRDQSLRRRYDYFLDKGFPKWKGTGYFYSKFRPGLILTIGVVFILVGTLHYISLKINRKQDYKRIATLKDQIKTQAWGSQFPPSDGSDRKVMNEATGKQFLISAQGVVNLIETDENNQQFLIPIDESEINVNPGFKESLFFKLPCNLWNLTLGKLTGKVIDTTVVFDKPETTISAEQTETLKKSKKKAHKGDKKELPNGKVLYGRPSNKARNRKQK
ncbi:DnaJ-domain-containing protein [Hyphopichia burtonii NRRL Y-1933]|uniref:DnaJ-domain-containing protein n=1 Tax=Hyphopichia burtonii NRRL Y-1933 TaxID=984485 RepID=A0A1E4RJE8_9ASCO|nr:DnaJ-domain-containing protein [Hyphopichia burtonii NRRL Y-1933]ODV67402.1 DnaJ-domain-containing protein [Hyphopichia burtonii NRRL Y-1933]